MTARDEARARDDAPEDGRDRRMERMGRAVERQPESLPYPEGWSATDPRTILEVVYADVHEG